MVVVVLLRVGVAVAPALRPPAACRPLVAGICRPPRAASRDGPKVLCFFPRVVRETNCVVVGVVGAFFPESLLVSYRPLARS